MIRVQNGVYRTTTSHSARGVVKTSRMQVPRFVFLLEEAVKDPVGDHLVLVWKIKGRLSPRLGSDLYL